MASTPASTPNGANGSVQYIRNFSLLVTDSNQNSIDLSNLRCKFTVKRSNNQSPNSADIRVYNLADATARQIQQNFAQVYTTVPGSTTIKIAGKAGTVVMQAGYNSNAGVIFAGNIRQVIVGRESATDTFIDLNCGDGDFAYNFAIVKTAVESADQYQLFNQIAQPMYGLGLNIGTTPPVFNPSILPRGKTMFGMSRDYLRVHSQQNGLNWSIQNEQITFVPQQGYAKGISVTLNSKTGMVGTPQQTQEGVNVVCLLNPNINPSNTISINNASVAALKVDLGNSKDSVNLAPPLNLDGVYTVLIVEQTGDTRGVDWYSKLICLSVAVSANPINSVKVNYGP